MASALYKFTRELNAIMSSNRASTDALGALRQWEEGAPGRGYSVEDDHDDYLEARIEWSTSDRSAGDDLNAATARVGVGRSYFERGTVLKVGERNGLVVVRCDDGSVATAKLMGPPDPEKGDVLTWTDRGATSLGRTTFTRKSDGYLWHVDETRFGLPESVALAMAR